MAENTTNHVIRTRDQVKAHDVARKLAGMTARTFGIRKYDARTWEVFPQQQTVDPQTFKAYVKIANAIKTVENN